LIWNMIAARAGHAVATLTLALVLGGCQSRVRQPRPTPGGWTAVDAGGPRDVASARDAAPRDVALPRDRGDDAAPRDAASGDGRRDAAIDATGIARDAGARDRGAADAGARDAGQDLGRRDAGTDHAGPAFCGPLHFNCAPFACDVDAGRCKTFCTSDNDCVPAKPCVNGLCGPNTNDFCQVDDECFSGHCAVVCCATACAGACHSCALPGSAGVCFPVPAGMPDPQNRCPAGTVCGADAGCVPAPNAGSN
jgi:hypothetical protein